MEILIAIVIVAVVAAFVSVPLRRARGEHEVEDAAYEAEASDLEARKQAKYREIRDTELDRASGKLSEEEFARQDAELRADAIAILKQIDALGKGRAKDAAATPRPSTEPEQPEPGDPSPPSTPNP
jgi:type II secretory pathway pseudopilin PulG